MNVIFITGDTGSGKSKLQRLLAHVCFFERHEFLSAALQNFCFIHWIAN